ncbi:MAG TPA: hypothetical protein VE032_04060 [Actinomycetota bacterium]|nr:hypothetical protein [Actinomycetota bacterium]
MAEVREHDAAIRRFSLAVTLIFGVGIVVISYGGARYYRRWSKVVDLLAGQRQRATRLRTGYVNQRANVSDVSEVAGIAMDQIAQAMEARRRGPGS